MRNLILSLSIFALVACGGNSNNAAPADPSTTGSSTATPSTTATTTASPASTATPATTSTSTSAPATTSTTATPTASTASADTGGATSDGKCGPVPPITATALAACLSDCDKLDDKVPPGAKCMPPRASCKSQCNTKFKK